MTLESIMTKLSKKYELLIVKLSKDLEALPSGSLYCKKEKAYFKWYHIIDDKEKLYISKNNENLAKSLALKMITQKRLEDVKKEKYAVDQYLRHHNHDQSKEEKFLNNANCELRRLVSLSYIPINRRYENWQNADFPTNTYKPELKRIRTLRGDLVRSKSEAIIADFLFQHQIPYRYECALSLNGHTIYPDFIVIHPVTGEQFIIEHFGMMDNCEYFSRYLEKIQIYAKSGYYPDSNLLCFYETADNPLNSAIVANKLEYFLNV